MPANLLMDVFFVDDMAPADNAPNFEWFLYMLHLDNIRKLVFNELRWGKAFTYRQLYDKVGRSKLYRDMLIQKGEEIGLLTHETIDPEKGQTKRIYKMPKEFFQKIDLLLVIKKGMDDDSMLGTPPSDDPEYDEWVAGRFHDKYRSE